MTDFQEFLKQQQTFANATDNNDSNSLPVPKNPMLALNARKDRIDDDGNVFSKATLATQNKPLYFRFVPYPDKPYNYDYREIWVTLHSREGKAYPARLVFNPAPKEGPDDKLAQLIKDIVHINYVDGTKDNPEPIVIQENSKFGSRLADKHAVQVALVDENGQYTEVIDKKIPAIHIVELTNGAFKDIAKQVLSQWKVLVNGKFEVLPFTDYAHVGIVTAGETISTSLAKGHEQTDPIAMTVKESTTVRNLPPYWADKDADGNYLYMDDPAVYNQPTLTYDKRTYEQAYTELKGRLDQYQAMNGATNPYAVPQAPQAPQAPVTPAQPVVAPTSPYAQQKATTQPVTPVQPTAPDSSFNQAVQEATTEEMPWENVTPNQQAQDIPTGIPTAQDVVAETKAQQMPPVDNSGTSTAANETFKKQIEDSMGDW